MILQPHTFGRVLQDRLHRWAGASNSKVLMQCVVGLLVGMCISGWVCGVVQAANFGPIADGDVSALIDAIESANDEGINPGPDTIILTSHGTYTLSMTADPRIPFVGEGNNGLPPISSTVTIQGNKAVIERDASLFTDPEDQCSSLNDDDKFRIIMGSGNLTLENVTIQNGCADNFDSGFEAIGGGIFKQRGEMTLIHSIVHNNMATEGGGGIGGYIATVTLSDSTVNDNKTTGQGAGIFNLGGTVNLMRSKVSSNTVNGFSGGGGIENLGGPLTLKQSTVSGNMARDGGGIRNDGGTVTLMHSTVSENKANSRGGGIQSFGTLTMTYSTVSGNRAIDGGGIDISGEAAVVTLSHSTVSGNVATGRGGGLCNFISPATVTLINSTVSGNVATEGGGLFNEIGPGKLTLVHSTVSGNTATSNGGGLFIETEFLMGTVTLSNTIIADQVSGQDCFDDGFTTFISTDFNLDSDGTCHLTQGNDKPNGSANLGPLQVNAPGTTATHALQTGSEAIDMGDCSGGTIVQDQRGVSRPQGNNCDIGAFEVVDDLVLACDINQDQMVDRTDIGLIFAARNTPAMGPDDLRDQDGDGTITVTDGRLCALECTNPGCMPSVP